MYRKVAATYELNLSSLVQNPTWGPYTVSLVKKKAGINYGRIGLLVQYVAYTSFFMTPQTVDIDTATPMFFVVTIRGASIAVLNGVLC